MTAGDSGGMMIAKLAQRLNVNEQEVLDAVRFAAGSGELNIETQRTGIWVESGYSREWVASGWSLALICGPDKDVWLRTHAPLLVRTTRSFDGSGGTITLRELDGAEREYEVGAELLRAFGA